MSSLFRFHFKPCQTLPSLVKAIWSCDTAQVNSDLSAQVNAFALVPCYLSYGCCQKRMSRWEEKIQQSKKKKSSFLWFMFANMQVCKYKIHDKSESCWSKPILWVHTKKVDENIINIHKNCPYNCTLFFPVF